MTAPPDSLALAAKPRNEDLYCAELYRDDTSPDGQHAGTARFERRERGAARRSRAIDVDLVRDAEITWNDDLRNAPRLVLGRVQFRLENAFGRHRFGLRGTLPDRPAASAPMRSCSK